MALARGRWWLLLGPWAAGALVLAGRRDFWGDEIGSLTGASQSLVVILQGRGADFHPPLYFVLLHAWHHLFGVGEYASRGLSVVAAALTVLLTASLARRAGVRRPWVGALLVGLSPFWLLFCGMARYYSLSALLFLVSLLALFSAMEQGRLWPWLRWGLVVALCGYTNYLTLASAVVAGSLLALTSRRTLTLGWAAGVGTALVAMAPLAALAIAQTRGMMTWGERASFASRWKASCIALVYPLYVLAASETVFPWRWAVSVPMVVGSAVLAAVSRSRLWLVLAGSLATGVAIVFSVARSLPLVYLPSRLLFLAPVWAVLVVLGAQRLGRPGTAILLVVVAGYGVGLANLVLERDYHNVTYLVPWRAVVATIKADPEPDKLVVATEEYPLLHYGRGLRFQLVRPGQRVTKELAVKAPKVVWLVERDRGDRQRSGITSDAHAWLSTHYDLSRCDEYLPLGQMEQRVRGKLLGREPGSAALTVSRFVRRW